MTEYEELYEAGRHAYLAGQLLEEVPARLSADDAENWRAGWTDTETEDTEGELYGSRI